MTKKKALLNPHTGVILSWTPELAKRHDLVPVEVDENFNRIVEVNVIEEAEEAVVKAEEKPKRGRKKAQ